MDHLALKAPKNYSTYTKGQTIASASIGRKGSFLANRIKPKVSLLSLLNKMTHMESVELDEELITNDNNGLSAAEVHKNINLLKKQFPKLKICLL